MLILISRQNPRTARRERERQSFGSSLPVHISCLTPPNVKPVRYSA